MFGVIFWVMIVFTLMCVAGGYMIARLGPQLFPVGISLAPAASSSPSRSSTPSVDARLADIQARLAAQEIAPSVPLAAANAQIAALSARVDRLEADRQRLIHASAAALSATSLTDAAASSGPFSTELSAVQGDLTASPDVQALQPLAATGAPTPAALAAEFPDVAARAAVAVRARARGSGFFDRIAEALAAIVTVRRVDRVDGPGVDAVLARAQRKVDAGDLAGALTELNGLPPAGQNALADWRARAARRVEIDRRVAAVRASALAELNAVAREGASPGAPP
jgi:hypothetical protein